MSRTLVRNSADPEQVKAAAQTEQLRGEREQNDLKSLMGTVYGRRFIRRQIVDVAGLYRSTHGNEQVFLEGMRNVGLQLLSEVQDACPEQWLQAEAEHHESLRMEGLKK